MKKFLIIFMGAFAFSCNSGNTTGDDMNNSTNDSIPIINPGAVRNDIPMRTTDTGINLMADTGRLKDTMK